MPKIKLTEVVFDLETKSFFEEEGPRDPSKLGVSLVSLYNRTVDENFNELEGGMLSFFESDFNKMWPYFDRADRIIGFNSLKFDVPALAPYAPAHFIKLPHFDIIQEVKRVHGRRISLNALAKDTLGKSKNDSAANAIEYFQKGDQISLALLKKYCEMDVLLTKELYDFGLKNKQLKFIDHWNTPRVITIDFSYPAAIPSNQIGLF